MTLSLYQSTIQSLLPIRAFPSTSMEDLDRFKKSHKALAFTCRLSGCARSTIGFENDRLRTEHEQSHISLIFCEYAGCQYPSFSSARALRSHTAKWHDQALQEKPKRSIRAQKIPKPAQDRRPRSGSPAPSPSQLVTPDAHSLPSKASSKAVPLSNWRPTRPYGSSTESIDYSDLIQFEELHPTNISSELSFDAHPSPDKSSSQKAPTTTRKTPTPGSPNQTQGSKNHYKPDIGESFDPHAWNAAWRKVREDSYRTNLPHIPWIINDNTADNGPGTGISEGFLSIPPAPNVFAHNMFPRRLPSPDSPRDPGAPRAVPASPSGYSSSPRGSLSPRESRAPSPWPGLAEIDRSIGLMDVFMPSDQADSEPNVA